jgi:hypothetical protein
MAENPTNVLSLSTELLIQVFGHLDPVHSTCLGLVSRRLWAIYTSLNKKIALDACTYECPVPSTNMSTLCFLHTHLQDWMPKTLIYCGACHKFCRTNNSRGKPVTILHSRCDTCTSIELGQPRPEWFSLIIRHGRSLETAGPRRD